MNKKIVLILVDGMRADAVLSCGSDYAPQLLSKSTYSLNVRTVMPSVTLPCHMSLFHSVDPDRHGIVTNTYTPQVRPIEGLAERLNRADKKCAFFFTWEELRDLSRPESLARSLLINLHKESESDAKITGEAISYIQAEAPDFVFLYLGETDECGHGKGWMGEEYMETVRKALACVRRVRTESNAEYDVILTADHGGHNRSHGTDAPEDMTIPLICCGPSFDQGKQLEGLSIKDIAPTIAELLGASPAPEWEGSSFLNR